MSNETNTISQRYNSAFALDEAKLSRMIDIVEERFKPLNEGFGIRYEITLQNGKNVVLNDLEDLFKLDNTIGNPITVLSIQGNTRVEEDNIQCKIDFDSSWRNEIELNVTSNDAKWAKQLEAELEEQVERTLLDSWIYRYFKPSSSSIFGDPLRGALMVIILISIPLLVFTTSYESRKAALEKQETTVLQEVANQAKTMEEKIDFLFELHKSEVIQEKPSDTSLFVDSLTSIFNLQTFFVVLPIIIIIGSFIYLVKTCYPSAVFVWGDWNERYRQLLDRRKNIWTVIVISLLIGVVANLFVFGISPFIRE